MMLLLKYLKIVRETFKELNIFVFTLAIVYYSEGANPNMQKILQQILLLNNNISINKSVIMYKSLALMLKK